MDSSCQPSDKALIRNVVLSQLAISIFVVLALNALRSALVLSELVQYFDFNELIFSIKNGYLALNNVEFGMPIFLNILVIIVLWCLMIWDILRENNDLNKTFNTESISKYCRKFAHMFF